jgi:hypothetical protein
LRDKSAAGKDHQAEQSGDEKANTETHCMQFSAIGPAVDEPVRLTESVPYDETKRPPSAYDKQAPTNPGMVTPKVPATKFALVFPNSPFTRYNGLRAFFCVLA